MEKPNEDPNLMNLYEFFVRHSDIEITDDGKVRIMLSDDRGMIISHEEYDRILAEGAKAEMEKEE